MSASFPKQEMDPVSIKIKLEDGPQYELSSPTYEQVTLAVFNLSRQNRSVKIPDLPLKMEIPAFGRSHMLVETPVQEGAAKDVVVYGVRCPEDAKMSPEQVAKRIDEVFGVNVHDTITAMKTPESMSAEGNDGSTYPCGTLFTSGSHSTSSSYSPALPPAHTHPHTPSPRPGHLPMLNSHLTTPKPVVVTNRNCRNEALVAGTGSYNVPGDTVNEDSVPANNQYRKAPVEAPVAIHQGLEPVHKAEQQHAGETPQMGVINLETPSQNMPYSDVNTPAYPFMPQKVQLKVEPSSEPRTPEQVAVEISSEESEDRLPNPLDCGLVAENCEKKGLSNQLVVGIGKQRKISMGSVEPAGLAPPTFGRQLSLPGEKLEKQQLPHRNSSDNNLAGKHIRSTSDLGLNLEVSPCAPVETPKDTPLSPGHTPVSPTKPLAIQRQESVAAPEQIEYVMPRPVNVVLCDNTQAKDTHMAVLSEPPVFKKVADESTKEPSTQDSSGQNEDGGAFKVLEVKQAATPTDEGSDSDQQLPLSDVMQQVHLLEHAMNEHCFLKEDCKALTRESTEFKQAVEQMKCMIEEARNGGQQDQDLKEYILVHCRQCRDKGCKIPHIWAGCPPASSRTVSGTGTGTEATDSPYYQPSDSESSYQPHQQPATVSFDRVPANISTTSDVKRHFEQKCTISEIQPIKYGPTPPDSPKDIADNGPIQPAEQDQTAPFSPLLNQQRIHGNPPQRVSNAMYIPSVQKRFAADQQGSGHLSPMYSGGFNLPGVRGQQYQESQLGAENYHHQVSDRGPSELRPGEREQIRYQYIEPSKSGGGLRNMYQRTENKFFTVAAGCFPAHRQLPWKPGALIYTSKNGELVPGVYSYPHNVPDRDWLGKGGNGTVIKFFLGGTEYALKMTSYREGELNTWSLLQHRNILPLLGVMLGEHGRCYQFMPRMTGDLRSMLIDHGDLCTHLKKHPEKWGVFSSNCVYVLSEVVTGLQYLHKENIQHSDLKANNILIKKKCNCPDLLHCDCTGEDKYDVKLADFDSLKKTQFARKAEMFSEVCRDAMNEMQMNGVKGTPAYRAPEQFKSCPQRMEFKKTLHDGGVCYDMEGPWCDMWSLGVIVLQMVLGSHNKGPYISEASILTNCKASKMQPRIESSVAQVRLLDLQCLSDTHQELKPFAKVARECLKIDCRLRATADSILQLLQSVSK